MSAKSSQTILEAVYELTKVSSSFKFAIARRYDRFILKQIFQDYKIKRLVRSQRFDLNAHVADGSDLAVSKFVLDYCGGKVRDQNKNWLSLLEHLPQQYDPSFQLTALVARQAKLISEGIDNFADLNHLETIDLSENPELDDFACDQLARQFRNSTTLKTISLNFNPQITIYGLDILFRIPSIERIEAVATKASTSEEIDIFTLSAKDERNCDVFVHEHGSQFTKDLDELIKKETPLV